MKCFLILLCALWLMLNWNQYFLMSPLRFLNRRNIKESESGIWHVFTIVAPVLVTICLLVICFFPHLIISRFDNIPCSTPRYSTPLSLFHLDNLALVQKPLLSSLCHPLGLFHLDNLALIIATILIAGTIVFWFRRLWNAVKNGSSLNSIYDKKLQVKLNYAINEVERLTNHKLPEVRMINSQLPLCFTKGWLRSRIWISDTLVSKMNKDDLQVILAHEHCHVLRYDNLVSYILTFISDLSWVYPGCRTLLKGWYERRELFCDNFSAQVVASRQKVASTLVKLAEVMIQQKGFHVVISGAAFYGEKPLIQTRVENLLCKEQVVASENVGARYNVPLRTYRYKLCFLALSGLSILAFVVAISLMLASSLSYIHCLMEDVFSLYCSAC